MAAEGESTERREERFWAAGCCRYPVAACQGISGPVGLEGGGGTVVGEEGGDCVGVDAGGGADVGGGGMPGVLDHHCEGAFGDQVSHLDLEEDKNAQKEN